MTEKKTTVSTLLIFTEVYRLILAFKR